MAMRYYEYTIDTDDPAEAVRQVSEHGIVVRTHSEGKKTRVYVAAERAAKSAKGLQPAHEVSEADVLKIG